MKAMRRAWLLSFVVLSRSGVMLRKIVTPPT